MAEQLDNAHKAAEARLKSQRAFWTTFGGFAVLWIACTIIWALSGGGGFWPIWVILGTGVATLFLGWSAFGPRSTGPTEAEVDEEAKKFEN